MNFAGSSSVTTTIKTDELVITRVFDAPRDRVWKAWTEADRLEHWWGPKGCKLRVVKLDLRPGGMFHYAMEFQPGNPMYGRFIYREIAAPERLVFVTSFSDENGGITRPPFPQIRDTFPPEILNTVTFAEAGGKTTVTLRGGPIDPTEAEMQTYAGMFDSMRQGFGGTFEQLDAYLAKA
jgi:uncharacterized protein YndB with AHSA1/START domain